MLGAVVHEHAADILHRRYGDDVQNEDDEAEPALREVVADAVTQLFGEDEIGKDDGQHDEQPEREQHAENGRERRDDGHDVDVQLLFAPLFKAARLPFVAVHFGAAHKDARTRNKGRDEVDDAAHERDLCDPAHVLGGIQPPAFDLDVALWVAHGGGVRRFAAHHHPFEHRLPADVGALLLLFCGSLRLRCFFL